MNFNELMVKMRELDQPATEACGDPMGMNAPMIPSKPDTPPPSMSVNLNAQGLDDIAELMKLMTKVNPDMINQPAPMSMPGISDAPSMISIKPPMGPLGDLDKGPLKMLPDMDRDNDDMPGGEMDLPPGHDRDHAMVKDLDVDMDGDHDMDDHDAEDDERKDKDETFANSPADVSGQEYYGIDAAMPDGNDLNRPKKSFSGKPYRGDNPMAAGAYESKEQLQASIKQELRARLAEALGR